MAQTKHRDDQLFVAPVELTEALAIHTPDGTPVLTKVPAPSTGTTETDMTEAELLGGIHVKTPTAAQNLQVPTGTEISAAVTAVQPEFAIGDSFDFTLINLGGTGDIVTLTVDTGVTFVGYMGEDEVFGADK